MVQPNEASAAIQPTLVVQRVREVLFSQLDDELVAIDAQAGYCYSLNETAGRVWELLATPMSLGALCAQLCREYRVDEATCLREVSAIVEGLRQAGLVQIDNGASR